MTVHADRGAAIIKGLLEEPSAKLEEDMTILRQAMGQVDQNTGTISGAAPAVTPVRSFYAALARRIEATSTQEAEGARRLALSGLRELDAGYGLLASALAQNLAAASSKEIEGAASKIERGAQALARAAESID